MRIVLTSITAINPHVIRVSLYTTSEDTGSLRDYELAMPAEIFTTKNTETNAIEIDLDKFQQVVSEKVIETNNMANLAKAIEDRGMEWELIAAHTEVETPNDKDGLLLAYGDDTNANTES